MCVWGGVLFCVLYCLQYLLYSTTLMYCMSLNVFPSEFITVLYPINYILQFCTFQYVNYLLCTIWTITVLYSVLYELFTALYSSVLCELFTVLYYLNCLYYCITILIMYFVTTRNKYSTAPAINHRTVRRQPIFWRSWQLSRQRDQNKGKLGFPIPRVVNLWTLKVVEQFRVSLNINKFVLNP